MGNKFKNNKNNERKSRVETLLTQLHDDMNQSMVVQRAQDIRTLPSIPDVPRMRLNPDKITTIRLSYRNLDISTQGGVDTYGALSFRADFTNSTFGSVFDQYRILEAAVTFEPAVWTTGTPLIRQLYTSIDYDDANSPTDPKQVLCNPTCQITPINIMCQRVLRPKASSTVYAGAITTAYAEVPRNTWLDCAIFSVPHYGLKYYCAPTGVATTISSYTELVIQLRRPILVN